MRVSMQEALLQQLVRGALQAQANQPLRVIAPRELRAFNPFHGQNTLGRQLVDDLRRRHSF